MKLNLILFFFCTLVTLSWAQSPNLSKYNEEIKKIENTVKYFEVEKINDQFYMLIGGGGNVGVFVSDKNVIMVDNKYEIIEEVLMSSLREITSNPIKHIINTHTITIILTEIELLGKWSSNNFTRKCKS
jgi:ABC-type enterochelin transport system ATPase subunit